MKFIISFLFLLTIISCTTEPQPLVAGKDECYYCKMRIADTKFGAEIITAKGKLYKFDDIKCMIDFMNSELLSDEKIKNLYAVNYINSQVLLNVNEATFLKSSNLRSPMNSGIAAFGSLTESESFTNDFPGEILTWQQLQQKLK